MRIINNIYEYYISMFCMSIEKTRITFLNLLLFRIDLKTKQFDCFGMFFIFLIIVIKFNFNEWWIEKMCIKDISEFFDIHHSIDKCQLCQLYQLWQLWLKVLLCIKVIIFIFISKRINDIVLFLNETNYTFTESWMFQIEMFSLQ